MHDIDRRLPYDGVLVLALLVPSLDREVDLISPLVTPLTYEGLIDDTVGIEKGRVRLDAAVLGSAEQQDAMSVKMAAQSGAEAAAAAGMCAI